MNWKDRTGGDELSKFSQEYREKLKDPRWQKKRLEIFERDEFRCRYCGTTEKTLSVHHLFYIKGCDPWEYPDEVVITLCEDCHESETSDSSSGCLISALHQVGFSGQTIRGLAEIFDDGPRMYQFCEFVLDKLYFDVPEPLRIHCHGYLTSVDTQCEEDKGGGGKE